MSVPQEHDYITSLLSEASPMERASEKKLSSCSSSSCTSSTDLTITTKSSSGSGDDASLNLRATELRLGLPGSLSPERKPQATSTASLPAVSLFSPLVKSFVSGAKRGFSDAIEGPSASWAFPGTSGSEVDLGKGGALFSPRGDGGTIQKHHVKEVGVLGGAVSSSQAVQEKDQQVSGANDNNGSPAAKAQVVGWPPIRSFRKNTMASNMLKSDEEAEGKMEYGCLYVKVSMEGAPYLRKVDLKTYSNYMELSSALEKMFSCFTIGKCGSQGLYGRDGLNETSLKSLLHDSEYVLTYEDKDGDWMLVGDVPWEMFTESCNKLRIMKGSEAIGLAPRAMEKCKSRN